MSSTTKQQKSQERVLSSLNVAIAAMDVAEKIAAIPPAKAAFSIVKEILTMVKVQFPLLRAGIWRAEMWIGHHGE